MANVHIATPSYSNTVTSFYLQTLMNLNQQPDLNFSYTISPGESLVTRVRNGLFADYVANRMIRGNTHLLWLDDDIGFDSSALASLLDRSVDVCGLAVPLRRHNRDHGINCAVEGATREVDTRFYQVSRLGCGMMMWSNDAVDALVEYCFENDLTYNNSSRRDVQFFDVFQVGTSNGVYLSEDYVACEILRGQGFDIFVDSNFSCIHSQPNDQFVRPPMDIDPRALLPGPRDPLPTEERDIYWSPADYALGMQ